MLRFECMQAMEFSFQMESVIRGHHASKTVWTPFVGEVLSLSLESGNAHDRFAVSIVKNDAVVGHVPRELSQVFFHFMQHDRTITVEVTGH